MLITLIKDLENTRVSVTTIEDWYLPAEAKFLEIGSDGRKVYTVAKEHLEAFAAKEKAEVAIIAAEIKAAANKARAEAAKAVEDAEKFVTEVKGKITKE
jgi:hypothetical protein